MVQFFKVILAFLFLNLFVIACTNNSGGTAGNVQINIPAQNKSQSTGVALGISRVILNVSGSNYFQTQIWDSQNPNEAAVIATSSFAIAFPQDQDSYLQAVVAYGNGDAGGMQIFYGSNKVHVKAGATSVSVDVNSLSGTGDTLQGQITGRFIPTAGVASAPTGLINIVYTPGDGLPPLIIGHASIVAGWFSAFGLQDIPLNYVTDQGLNIFGQAVSLNGLIAAPQNSVFAAVKIPGSIYRSQLNKQLNNGSGNGSSVTYTPITDSRLNLVGYFGGGVSNSAQQVCLDSFTGSSNNYFSSADNSSPISYGTTGTTVTAQVYNNTISTCATATSIISSSQNTINVNPAMFENGNDSVGISGAFMGAVTAGTGGFVGSLNYSVQSDNGNGTLSIDYKTLPDAPYSHYNLYMVNTSNLQYSDYLPCPDIANGTNGYSAATLLVSGISDGSEVDFLVNESASGSPNQTLVVCPLVDGVLTNSGIKDYVRQGVTATSLTMISSQSYISNTPSGITLSGICVPGATLTLSSTPTVASLAASTPCTSGSWSMSFSTSPMTAQGNYAFSVSDGLHSAGANVIKDTVAPTISSFTLNGGSTNLSYASDTGSGAYVPNVVISANDSASGLAANSLCLRTGPTPPTLASDSCFENISAMNPVNSYHFSAALSGSGNYVLYAWVADKAGNISSLSNAGAGTSGVDSISITINP